MIEVDALPCRRCGAIEVGGACRACGAHEDRQLERRAWCDEAERLLARGHVVPDWLVRKLIEAVREGD